MSKELDIINSLDQSKINNSNKNNAVAYEKLPIQYSDNQTLSSDKNYNLNKDNNSFYIKLALRYKLPKDFKSIFKKIKLGKSIGVSLDINNDPIIIISPQWPYFILLFLLSNFLFFLINHYTKFNKINFLKYLKWPFYFLWTLIYFLVSLKNPGYPKNNLEHLRGSRAMLYCDKCEIWYKPDSNTIHCNVCDICVEGYNHHCKWFGHCVGKRNIRLFFWFIVISLLFLVYLLFVFIISNYF